MSARRGALPLALALAVVAPRATHAQQFRFRSTTTGRYVQLRPLVLDTVLGTFVSGVRQYAAPLTEDLEISAWGFGVRGLRAYGLLRVRGSLGSPLVWPRYDDHFDALWGYLELERTTYRVRLGRQQRASSLGFYAFDGALGTWRPQPNVRVEAYAGRGLARGILDGYANTAVSSIDPVIPDRGTLLAGASVWAAPSAGSTVSAVYQREITSDRSALVSERAALDAQVAAGRHLLFAAYADADLAGGQWGKARLSGALRLPSGGRVEVAAFRYRPVFPLNTIWGVFAPQAYSGASVTGDVSPLRRLTLSGSLTYRRYTAATETTPFAFGMSDHSSIVTVGAQWVEGNYVFRGDYSYQAGYGGGQSGGSAELAYDRGGTWRFGLRGTGFQEAEEFRVASGTVIGLGADARARLARCCAIRGDLTRYWQTDAKGGDAPDWSQLRGSLTVDITFGASADRTTGAAGGYR